MKPSLSTATLFDLYFLAALNLPVKTGIIFGGNKYPLSLLNINKKLLTIFAKRFILDV